GLRLLLENTKRGQLILDLLQGRQHGLAVRRDGLIECGLLQIDLRVTLARVEQRLGERRGDRPEPARPGEQRRKTRGGKASRRVEVHRWKIRRLRDADLLVRRRHQTLPGRPIPPAAEHLRWDAERYRGR